MNTTRSQIKNVFCHAALYVLYRQSSDKPMTHPELEKLLLTLKIVLASLRSVGRLTERDMSDLLEDAMKQTRGTLKDYESETLGKAFSLMESGFRRLYEDKEVASLVDSLITTSFENKSVLN